VVDNYLKLGYKREDAEKLLIFTKLERRLPELRERFAKGHISSDDVVTELKAIGVPETRIVAISQRIVKAPKPERTKRERDLTKAEIVKGVKKEILTPDMASHLLTRMGYDPDEAAMILAINGATVQTVIAPDGSTQFQFPALEVQPSTGSYNTPLEHRRAVELIRAAQGLSHIEIDDTLIAAEQDAKLKQADANLAKQSGASRLDRAALEQSAQEAEFRFRQLLGLVGL
jgi:hypothetical protein